MPTEAVKSLEAYKTWVDFKTSEQPQPKTDSNLQVTSLETLSNLDYSVIPDHLTAASELSVVNLSGQHQLLL